MAKRMARFKKYALRCGVGLLVLVCLFLLVAWLAGPSLVESWFADALEEEGYEASVEVEALGFSGMDMSDLKVTGKGLSAEVSEISAHYELGGLMDGKIKDLVVKGVEIDLDLDLFLEDDEPEDKALEVSLRELVDDWPFAYTTAQGVGMRISMGEAEADFRIDGRVDATEPTRPEADVNGSLGQVFLTVGLEAKGVSLETKATVSDLSHAGRLARMLAGNLWPQGLELTGGSAKLEARGVVVDDRVADTSIDLGLENLQAFLPPLEGHADRMSVAVSRLLLAAQVEGDDSWRIDRLEGIAKVSEFLGLGVLQLKAEGNAQGMRMHLQNATGWAAVADERVHFTGIRTELNVLWADPGKQVEPARVDFESIRYGKDVLVLGAGAVDLQLDGLDRPVAFSLLETNLDLPAFNLQLEGMTFEGRLNSIRNPSPSGVQWLRCKRLNLAKEPFLDKLQVGFRMDDNSSPLVDSLDFEMGGTSFAVRGDGIPVRLTEGGGAVVKMNDVTIELPDFPVVIEGVTGVVSCDTLDPLLISEPQELAFSEVRYEKLRCGPGKVFFSFDRNGTLSIQIEYDEVLYEDLACGPGKIILSLDRNGTLAGNVDATQVGFGEILAEKVKVSLFLDGNETLSVSRCELDLMDGRLWLKPFHLKPFVENPTISFTAVLEGIDAARLVEAMPGFKGELQGLLSGEILLSNAGGTWDYLEGGGIRLETDPEGFLSYPADGWLTEGIEPGTALYQDRRNVEKAFQDIKLEVLYIEFLDEMIRGKISGQSQVEIATPRVPVLSLFLKNISKPKVTYNLETSENLIDLLTKLQLAGMSFE